MNDIACCLRPAMTLLWWISRRSWRRRFRQHGPGFTALFQSLAEYVPETVVIDLDTIVPEELEVFEYVETVREAAPQILRLMISRTPLRNARQRKGL